jgi:methyl-accepting chemotaxis protein
MRDAYDRVKANAQTVRRRQLGLATNEVAAAIEATKGRISKQAGGASETVAEDLEELRRLVEVNARQAQETVATHPLSALAGAVAIGFMLGRMTR